MGMMTFRRLRAQEAAATLADSIDTVVAERKDSTPQPATFNEPAEAKPARKSRRSVAMTAEN